MRRLAVALAVAALLAGCGARTPAATAAAPAPAASEPPAEPMPGGRPDEQRAEIARLDEAITADLARAGLGAPGPEEMAAVRSMSAGDAARVCTRATPPVGACADVCTAGDSICKNADSICRIAGELPGDAWGAERCDAGKASCQRARSRCCECK